ncbi:MAG TPA: sterol desaturase family protein [Myxococcales bacterium]|nr:sterol desaturase [Myxococcales bacterium]HAN30442.1 sterol desaturase family protein [Myxococcales bacterium]|tara:strand:- start:75 stop:1292 length:1218 start_codon:yes stop_codon:yes gene_type:complete
MGALLIAMAVPMFVVLIGIESWIGRGRGIYRFSDAVIDLSCGLASRMFHLFDFVVVVGVYTWVYQHAAYIEIEGTPWWLWIVAFVAVDLLYYCWHRASHGVNVLWAVHAVHHQSEDYNLAVALRQALFSSLTGLPFYLPLAVLGVPPLVFGTCNALNTLYQFWIHTELIRTLPAPVEMVMNTPSHHRVHHGINPQYLDRNHAGVFIVWDRLLGTFEPESEEVVYGLVSPLRSFNPIWANLIHLVGIYELIQASESTRERLAAIFAGPAWRPTSLGGPKMAPPVTRQSQKKYDPEYSPARGAYIAATFSTLFPWSVWLMAVGQNLPLNTRLVAAIWVVWTLAQCGALFERKRWAHAGEYARLLCTCLLSLVFISTTAGLGHHLGWVMLSTSGLSALWLRRIALNQQ